MRHRRIPLPREHRDAETSDDIPGAIQPGRNHATSIQVPGCRLSGIRSGGEVYKAGIDGELSE